MDRQNLSLVILGILVIATAVTWLWGQRELPESSRRLQQEVMTRVNGWWVMAAVFLAAWWGGFIPTVLLFYLISAFALREYLTLIDTKRADHRALIWSFLILTPLQYYFIGIHWYGLFSIFIPVYGFLIVTARVAFSGDCDDFLCRVATIHWGLMTSVFLVSHAPALLTLSMADGVSPALLFFYLVVLTELSDVLQFICGKAFGRRKVAPTVSPNKTVEGLFGGAVLTGGCALFLHSLTPFHWSIDFLTGVLLCVAGFAGGLVMSAVKRDYGRKDFGSLISGHGGVLDRIDSLCFTAPLFFHFVRYFYSV